MPSLEPNHSQGPEGYADSQRLRFWGWILWPSFLAACLLEGLVFAVVDPAQLHWPDQVGSLSSQAIYTLAFFAFWIINMACCRVVLGLAVGDSSSSRAVNGRAGD
jgi:hypothetical protein